MLVASILRLALSSQVSSDKNGADASCPEALQRTVSRKSHFANSSSVKVPGPGRFAFQKIEATWPEIYQKECKVYIKRT